MYGAKAVAEKAPYKLGLQIRPISRTRASWAVLTSALASAARASPPGGILSTDTVN